MADRAAGSAVLSFEGRTLRFERPVRVIAARALADVVPALQAAEAAALGGQHAVGFVAYEAAPAFDAALQVRPGNGLLAWFGIYEHANGGEDGEKRAPIAPAAVRSAGGGTVAVAGLEADMDAAEYGGKVAAIRAAIGRGDVYQVNHTLRFRGRAVNGTLAPEVVAAWRRGQGHGYFADLDLGAQRIVSLSPELFFRVRGREVTTRPMKGTARRGRWPAEDDAAAARLAASEKDRAENLMIVDLMRNDVGRVARFGSVRVPRLFEVERYPTVHQMTSTISAELQEQVGLTDVFRALFPCGSVTGAPKVAAMAMIAQLETSARGVYCGAIGHIEPGGDCTFSVAIRTLTMDTAGGALEYGAGGGITWDSNVAAEYDEVSAKAEVIRRPRSAFSLLETLLLEDGGYPRLAGHMERLAASAAYFGFAAGIDRIEATLGGYARALRGRWRMRLLVGEDGGYSVTATPLADESAAPLRVRLVAGLARSEDVFLYHKTTQRAVYDAALAAAAGCDEALLTNERGELTELATGNLVVEMAGVLYTPPRASGLLAGVFRDSLLRSGSATERALRPADLPAAQRCWLVNGVRGWREIASVEDAAGRTLFERPRAAALR